MSNIMFPPSRRSLAKRGAAVALGALLAGGLSLMIPGCLGGSRSSGDGANPGVETPGDAGSPLRRFPPYEGAPQFPLPKPTSPGDWGTIGAMVQSLRGQMPGPDRLYSIPDAYVRGECTALYQASQAFVDADFADPGAAQAAASQLHAAAQQCSNAVAIAIQNASAGPGPGPWGPGGPGHGPGGPGHGPGGPGHGPGGPGGPGHGPGGPGGPGHGPGGPGGPGHGPGGPGPGHRGPFITLRSEDVDYKWLGPCPSFLPPWAWCACTCDAAWEACVSSSPPWAWWWCDLSYWWSLGWCW